MKCKTIEYYATNATTFYSVTTGLGCWIRSEPNINMLLHEFENTKETILGFAPQFQFPTKGDIEQVIYLILTSKIQIICAFFAFFV